MRHERTLIRLVCALICLAPSMLFAQEKWPVRPVTVVIPYPAGGASDVITRLITSELTAELGQPFVAEPKPGANSNIAASTVANAAPDGYTFLISGPWIAINQFIETGRRWKPDSLVPVARLALTDNLLVVPSSSPIATLNAYVARAKSADATPLQYGSPGTGSTQRMAAELFSQEAGIQLQAVQYKGAPAIIPDLVSDRVSMSVLAAGNVTGLIHSGKLRGLASFGEQRGPNTPDIPTMAELGYKNAVAVSWFGLHAPAGTPEPIVKRLSDTLEKILQKPDLQKKFLAADDRPAFMNTADFSKYLQNQEVLWGKVASTLKDSE